MQLQAPFKHARRALARPVFLLVQWLKWHEDQIDEIAMWFVIACAAASWTIAYLTGSPF